MKTIFMLIIYLISMWYPNDPAVRYDTGIVSDCFYHEQSDSINTVFISSTGDEWLIEDYCANIGDKIIIEFDTMGTPDDIYDDSITGVITYSEIN